MPSPSKRSVSERLLFSGDTIFGHFRIQVDFLLIMRIIIQSSTKFVRMKKKSSTEPPKRERGRPSQGKTRINLTLNESLVERARKREENLSALLDRLLAQWLEKAA
jgi:hypothetical protein